VVLLFAAVGLAASLSALSLSTPIYEARSQLLLTPVAPDSGTTFGATDYVATRGRAYASIADSQAFQDRVQSMLGVAVDDPYPQISVTLEDDTTLLAITIRDTTAEGSQRAAETVDDLLVERSRILDSTTTGVTQVRMDVVSQPLLPGAPTEPRPAVFLTLGGLGGLMMGVATAIALGRPRARRSARAPLPSTSVGDSGPGALVSSGERPGS
jgi:capsular polysaccharide biosynthesis protein